MPKRTHSAESPRGVWQDIHWSEPSNRLLNELPHHDYHLGRFAGYNAGRSVRRKIVFGFVSVCAFGYACCFSYARHREYAKLHPFPLTQFEIQSSQRTLSWQEGYARLGLFREAPGVDRILLPDRTISLAEGCDHAQILVEVLGEKTILLTTLVGEIHQTVHRLAPVAE